MNPALSATAELPPTDSSLRAWPQTNNAAAPLSVLVDRITTQRGSFRNVTEQSLQEEVAALEAGTRVDGESSESDEDDGDEKPKLEQLYEAKAELLKFSAQAYNDSAHALDFISLMLSKYASKGAEMTMSPYLKQHVPMGSLGSEVLAETKNTEFQERSDSLVATGWKLQSLNSAADSLLRSASSLEKEMEKETKYWEEVLAVKRKGWSICRMPRERHSLAVRYGFLEAAPEFRDKGLAALRRDEDGCIDLDLGISSAAHRRVHVRIMEHGQVVAASRINESQSEGDQFTESAILQARNDRFDEELFHEIYREARGMTSRGVKCVGEGITIPIAPDVSMSIELRDINDPEDSVQTPSEKYSKLSQLAVTALRILLSHSHRQNYLRRSKLQPALTERRPQRPIPAILHPIVSYCEHRTAVADLQSYVDGVTAVLHKAFINFKYQPPANILKVEQLLKRKAPTRFIDTLLNSFLAPLQSTIKAGFGGDQETFAITIRTHSMGTEYKFTLTPPQAASLLTEVPAETSFSNLAELKNHFLHMITLWLVESVEATHEPWIASSPDEGELTTAGSGDESGDFEMLTITLHPSELRLRWNHTDVGKGEERRAVWRGDGNDAVGISFDAQAEEFSKGER